MNWTQVWARRGSLAVGVLLSGLGRIALLALGFPCLSFVVVNI